MRNPLTSLLVAVVATTATTTNAADKTLEERVAELERQVASNRDSIAIVAREAIKNRDNISRNIESIAANADNIGSHGRRIDSNVNRLEAASRQLSAASLDFRNQLDQISQYDSESGERVLSLAANMDKSRRLRKEVEGATTRKLWIYNPNRWEQHVYINGMLWRVRPLTWSYAPVAPGPVTVQKYFNGSRLVLTQWHRQSDGKGYAALYNLRDHSRMGVSRGGRISLPVGMQQ